MKKRNRKIEGNTKKGRIWEKTDGHCHLCSEQLYTDEWRIDHLLPRAQGGSDEEWNLLSCCVFCNGMKKAAETYMMRRVLMYGRYFTSTRTLTLHRLGVYGVLGRSLKTTNCLESINALVEERCAKVDHWQNSSQRHRWLATALLDIEPRLRKVMGYRHLPRLREALKRELNIDTTTSKKEAA